MAESLFYNMTMKMVNIHDVKARLSEYLDLVNKGERVLICRRNEPVAELRPWAMPRTTPRPLGGTDLAVPDAFFTSLPDDEVEGFYGEGAADSRTASRIAEAAASAYGPDADRRRKS